MHLQEIKKMDLIIEEAKLSNGLLSLSMKFIV